MGKIRARRGVGGRGLERSMLD